MLWELITAEMENARLLHPVFYPSLRYQPEIAFKTRKIDQTQNSINSNSTREFIDIKKKSF